MRKAKRKWQAIKFERERKKEERRRLKELKRQRGGAGQKKHKKRLRCVERAGVFDQHHIVPRSRGGTRERSNLIWLDIERHFAWHLLFGNKKPDEVIALLIRMLAIKQKGARP